MSKGKEDVETFEKELRQLLKFKPPISQSKVVAISTAAVKAVNHYKHVVKVLETFIKQCRSAYKLSSMYVIDGIIHQSRSKFGTKDVFTRRFALKLEKMLVHIYGCSSSDKSKVVRLLNLWQMKRFFTPEEIHPLVDMARLSKDELKAKAAAVGKSSQAHSAPVVKPSQAQAQLSSGTPQAPAAMPSGPPPSKQPDLPPFPQLWLTGQAEVAYTQPPPAAHPTTGGPSSGFHPVHHPTMLAAHHDGAANLARPTVPPPLQSSAVYSLSQVDARELPRRSTGLPPPPAPPVPPLPLFSADRGQVLPPLPPTSPNRQPPLSFDGGTSTWHGPAGGIITASGQKSSGRTPAPPGFSVPPSYAAAEEDSGDGSPAQTLQPLFNKTVLDSFDYGDDDDDESRLEEQRRQLQRAEYNLAGTKSSSIKRGPHTPDSQDEDDIPAAESSSRETAPPAQTSISLDKSGFPAPKPNHLTYCSITVRMDNVPPDATESNIRELFEEFGNIKAVERPSPSSALVHMLHRSDAVSATTALKNPKLRGVPIKLSWGVEKSFFVSRFFPLWTECSGSCHIPWTQLKEEDVILLSASGQTDPETNPFGVPSHQEDVDMDVAMDQDEMDAEPPTSQVDPGSSDTSRPTHVLPPEGFVGHMLPPLGAMAAAPLAAYPPIGAPYGVPPGLPPFMVPGFPPPLPYMGGMPPRPEMWVHPGALPMSGSFPLIRPTSMQPGMALPSQSAPAQVEYRPNHPHGSASAPSLTGLPGHLLSYGAPGQQTPADGAHRGGMASHTPVQVKLDQSPWMQLQSQSTSSAGFPPPSLVSSTASSRQGFGTPLAAPAGPWLSGGLHPSDLQRSWGPPRSAHDNIITDHSSPAGIYAGPGSQLTVQEQPSRSTVVRSSGGIRSLLADSDYDPPPAASSKGPALAAPQAETPPEPIDTRRSNAQPTFSSRGDAGLQKRGWFEQNQPSQRRVPSPRDRPESRHDTESDFRLDRRQRSRSREDRFGRNRRYRSRSQSRGSRSPRRSGRMGGRDTRPRRSRSRSPGHREKRPIGGGSGNRSRRSRSPSGSPVRSRRPHRSRSASPQRVYQSWSSSRRSRSKTPVRSKSKASPPQGTRGTATRTVSPIPPSSGLPPRSVNARSTAPASVHSPSPSASPQNTAATVHTQQSIGSVSDQRLNSAHIDPANRGRAVADLTNSVDTPHRDRPSLPTTTVELYDPFDVTQSSPEAETETPAKTSP